MMGLAADTVREGCVPNVITVHLLGSPCVSGNGHRMLVPEGSKRLLAFIALHQDGVERRYAAGSLWPFGCDDRALGNLRSALWRLRGAGIDIVKGDRSLRLDDAVTVDARQLCEWSDRVIGGRTNRDDLLIPTQHLNGLNLLPGWYDDWVTIERERLRQRVLHALELLSTKLASLGRYSDAVEMALIAINAGPMRESAYRTLMQIHLTESNWLEARRTYASYRQLTRRELGVDPSSDLRALLLDGRV
jgi:DNA-binding SARP family transcriptional activator